jgi:hypothetical protein
MPPNQHQLLTDAGTLLLLLLNMDATDPKQHSIQGQSTNTFSNCRYYYYYLTSCKAAPPAIRWATHQKAMRRHRHVSARSGSTFLAGCTGLPASLVLSSQTCVRCCCCQSVLPIAACCPAAASRSLPCSVLSCWLLLLPALQRQSWSHLLWA